MQRIYAKLKSQQGVSILYGLLFMLVALMTSAVMLGASVTAVKRVHGEEERTQDMLTLQSAAETLRAALAATTFETTITFDEEEGTVSDVELTSSSGPLAAFLGDTFASAVEQMKTTNYADITVEDIPLEVETDGVAEVLEDTEVEFSYTMPTKTHNTACDEEMFSLRMTIVLPEEDRQIFLWATSTTTSTTIDSTHEKDTTSWSVSNIAINTRKDKLWEQTS